MTRTEGLYCRERKLSAKYSILFSQCLFLEYSKIEDFLRTNSEFGIDFFYSISECSLLERIQN